LFVYLALSGVSALMGIAVHRSTVAVTPSQPMPSQPTPTPTSTAIPGPPELVYPEDGALLPQPVPPFQWRFTWRARTHDCLCVIYINGPGGRHISDYIYYLPYDYPYGYQYIYTQTEYLPDDALTPWDWKARVNCPLASRESVTRTFSVMPAAWFMHIYFLPIILKDS